MKYFYTYRVDCTAVGWEGYYYLGQHSTNDLNDGYKGSGRRIKEYYKQHPNDYIFTILEFYTDKLSLAKGEQELINNLYETDEYCLNLRGGQLGTTYTEEAKCKMRKKHKMTKEGSSVLSLSASKRFTGKPSWNKGLKMDEEFCNKVKVFQTGKKRDKSVGEKISKKLKGVPKSDTHKKNLSNAIKGKHRVYREDGTYYLTK